MEANFQVTTRTVNGVLVLSVQGEIDLSSAPKLLDQLVGDEGDAVGTVIADLSDVSFLDSSGLGALVTAQEQIREKGGQLRLVVTVPNVVKVFEIAGLTAMFAMHPTLGEALSS